MMAFSEEHIFILPHSTDDYGFQINEEERERIKILCEKVFGLKPVIVRDKQINIGSLAVEEFLKPHWAIQTIKQKWEYFVGVVAIVGFIIAILIFQEDFVKYFTDNIAVQILLIIVTVIVTHSLNKYITRRSK